MANTINNLAMASTATLRITRQLRLMRDRRADNQARLRILERRLAGTGEADTRANAELPITFGRYASDWTKRHEAHYQRRLSELRLDARNEIGSIEKKIDRQSAAITAFHLKSASRGRE